MYPTEPFNEGMAVIEYVVLNSELGDLETDRCNPLGTVKSRMAEYTSTSKSISQKLEYSPLEERVRLAYKLSSFHPVAL